jgi:hypothetical protein
MEGQDLSRAVDEMYLTVTGIPGSGDVTHALDAALTLVKSGGDPTPEKLERLGGGWVAEEALAIAVYCALVAEDFEHGVLLAVNHSGDSDSTASLTGQLIGTASGVEAIPARWLVNLELRDVINRIAVDLFAVRSGTFDPESDEVWVMYPGW